MGEDQKEAFKFQYPDISEYNPMEKFTMEKEVSGFYLSGHPLDLPEYQRFTKRSNITTVDGFTEGDDRKDIRIVGIIQIDEKEVESEYPKQVSNMQYLTLRIDIHS